MAFCINCGHQLAEGAKFCFECGSKVGDGQTSQTEQRKAFYDGEIHKCPSCGEVLQSFLAFCPVCNYELRGVQSTSCVHELALKLEKADSQNQKIELISNFYIPNTKEDVCEFFILAYSYLSTDGYGAEVWKVKLEQAYLKAKLAFGNSTEFKQIEELYDKIRKASLLGASSVKQLAKKLEQLESQRPPKKMSSIFAQTFSGGTQLQSIDEQKIDLIRNFPIPNTKEDVIEFIVYAAANVDLKVYGADSSRYQMLDPARRELSDAWLAKLEQADQKAELLLGNDPEYISVRNVYEKKLKEIKKQKRQILYIVFGTLGAVLLMFGLVITIIALSGGFSTNGDEANTGKPSYGESSQTTVGTLAEIPDEFIVGYEKAEFEKYNSPASENGLGGTKIYIAGRLIRTEVLNAEGTKTILGYVSDKDDNVWLIKMHVIPIVSEDHFASAVGKTVVCTVIYDGYSGVKEMPSTTLNELLIIETGTVIYGMQKLLD